MSTTGIQRSARNPMAGISPTIITPFPRKLGLSKEINATMKTKNYINCFEYILAGLRTGQGLLGFAAYLHRRGHKLVITKSGPSVTIHSQRFDFKKCGLMPAFIAMIEQSEGTTPRFEKGSPTAAILEARLTWIAFSKYSEDLAETNVALDLYMKWLKPSFVNQVIAELFLGNGLIRKEARIQCLHQLLLPAVNYAILLREDKLPAPNTGKKPKRRIPWVAKWSRRTKFMKEFGLK